MQRRSCRLCQRLGTRRADMAATPDRAVFHAEPITLSRAPVQACSVLPGRIAGHLLAACAANRTVVASDRPDAAAAGSHGLELLLRQAHFAHLPAGFLPPLGR